MRTLNLILLLSMFFFSACGPGTTGEGEAGADEDTVDMDAAANEASTTMRSYTLTPFEQSTAFPEATIESVSFQNGQFDFDISGYELGVQTPDADQKMCANSDQGQHIHVILDRQPYTAHYTADFEYDIDDGEHYLLSFLSRSYHESVKNPAARYARKITVTGNSITNTEEITGPMLFYSRPKGTYVGTAQTEKVMLDFYLLNADLGSEYMVKTEINGEEYMIDNWQPYYIEGLPMGESTIKLTLVDADANPVDVPLNPVERTITLQEDPAEATQ